MPSLLPGIIVLPVAVVVLVLAAVVVVIARQTQLQIVGLLWLLVSLH